jgi:diphthamide biosynthesis protein 4
MSTTTPQPTYYQILSLTPSHLSSSPDSLSLIKRAYRRALLSHHPDKNRSSNTSPSSQPPLYTIDQISLAYTTLSNPRARTAYDLSLISATSSTTPLPSQFQTGIETVDLDDLSFCEAENAQDEEIEWYRGCRCGNPKGYRFGEADLEEAADLGELLVGCVDCSLWLRVLFAVAEGEVGGEELKEGTDVGTR